MQFVSLGWQNQMGVIGGGRLGDSTALTTAHAEALFPDAVRSGAQLHYPTAEAQQAGGYVEIAANTVPLFPAFIDECAAWFRAILPQGQAVNLNTHSNNLTDASYVKTGCTATPELGGLKHGADWRGHEPDVNIDAGDVTPLGGVTVPTSATSFTSTGVGGFQVNNRTIVGRRYYIRLVLSATGPTFSLRGGELLGANIGLDGLSSGTHYLIWTAAQTGVYFRGAGAGTFSWTIDFFEADFHTRVTATVANATVTKTITRASALRNSLILADVPAGNVGDVRLSQDGGTVNVTLPDGFNETSLVPVTSVDPGLRILLTNSGDTVRVYDWTHEETSAPMFRNFRPIAGVSETVGPFSSGNTIASPATINVSALVQAPPAGARDYVVATWYTNADANVRLQVLLNAGNLILRRNASTDVTIATGIAAGDTCLIDVQWTATDIRGRLNLGAWATHTHEAIPAFDRMRIGSDHTPANHLSAPFVALWDRDGTLGLAKDGFNHGAVTCWIDAQYGQWIDDDGAFFVDDDGAFILLEV